MTEAIQFDLLILIGMCCRYLWDYIHIPTLTEPGPSALEMELLFYAERMDW